MNQTDDTYLEISPYQEPTPLAPRGASFGDEPDAGGASAATQAMESDDDAADGYIVKTCPNCGTGLVYSPDTGGEKCPSCGYQAEAAEASTAKIVENDLYGLLHLGELNEEPEQLTMACPACGATSQMEWNTVAGLCPFCKSPLTHGHLSARSLRPQGVIPFAVSREKAQASFADWIRRLWFAPGDLRAMAKTQSLRGVYRPVWTFDFSATCRYVGERGTRHTIIVTRRVNGKLTSYTKTVVHWHTVSGRVGLSFDDILSYADSRLPEHYQAEVEPWHLNAAVDYAEDKIRGFVETSYDKKVLDGLQDAKSKATARITEAVRADIGGDEQRILDMDISYSDLTYKLLLLPYWDSEYHYKNKNYKYIVNGQTGRAHGERPWSWLKITLLCLFIILLAAGATAMYVSS